MLAAIMIRLGNILPNAMSLSKGHTKTCVHGHIMNKAFTLYLGLRLAADGFAFNTAGPGMKMLFAGVHHM
jgi:hypothetical protein